MRRGGTRCVSLFYVSGGVPRSRRLRRGERPVANEKRGYFFGDYRVDITVWKTLWRM